MIIYLYLKQHNKTGLKYFGKTSKNPYIYNGSGVYWTRHLKTNGRDISTIKVWEFTRQEVCTRFALWYSKKFNIVKSKEYANLCLENGLDGGDKFSCMSTSSRIAYSTKHSTDIFKQWETRDRVKQATAIANVWASRDDDVKIKIYKKISDTLSAKTIEEKAVILSKYRKTVANRQEIVCSYCGTIGTSLSNMNRYHFDRCLSNPSALPRKPIIKITCAHCNKTTDPGNFKKHHGDQCKFKI